MKTTILYSLVLLTMLGIGLSCKKVIEEVKPPVVTKPGSSTTPTSTTPVATTPTTTTPTVPTITIPDTPTANYDNVPQPPANCRIVRTTYKTVIYQGPIIDREVITIDGKTFVVSTTAKTTYSYDNQGRLVKDRQERWLGKVDSVTYQYFSDKIISRQNQYQYTEKKYYSRTDTLVLNAQGLAISKPGSYLKGTFDTNNFLIKGETVRDGYTLSLITQSITNGNIQTKEDYQFGETGTIISTYSYYLTRPNLPTLTTFYGKSSKNLPAKMLISGYGSIAGDGLKYVVVYFYEFDSIGRIKRRIAYGIRLNDKWWYEFDTDGIGITDYEYECP
jgi:hypothetical protein